MYQSHLIHVNLKKNKLYLETQDLDGKRKSRSVLRNEPMYPTVISQLMDLFKRSGLKIQAYNCKSPKCYYLMVELNPVQLGKLFNGRRV